MHANVPRCAAGAPTDRVVAALREHGAVIVEGVLARYLKGVMGKPPARRARAVHTLQVVST